MTEFIADSEGVPRDASGNVPIELWYVPGPPDKPEETMIVRRVFDSPYFARMEVTGWTPLPRVEMDAGRPFKGWDYLPENAIHLIPEVKP